VLSARVELPRTRYPEAAARQQFFDRLLERARALPGVTGAAAGTTVLGRTTSSAFSIEGRTETIHQPLTIDVITPDFFQVLGVPLLRGRLFSHLDRADGPLVAIINETRRRRIGPTRIRSASASNSGRPMTMPGGGPSWGSWPTRDAPVSNGLCAPSPITRTRKTRVR
jgi:hypothetical protein